jgi:hypothetical protein
LSLFIGNLQPGASKDGVHWDKKPLYFYRNIFVLSILSYLFDRVPAFTFLEGNGAAQRAENPLERKG